MEEINPFQLKRPYDSLARQGRWGEYASALCRDGLAWWFNMDIPCIAAHLAPLQNLPPGGEPPPRLVFLAETIRPAMSAGTFDELFRVFEAQGDVEAAAAAACAGATSIWDSGVNFERFTPWFERITGLLEGGARLPDLTRAGLLCFRAQCELTFHGDMSRSIETYREMMALSEKAGAPSLKVFSAAAQVYPLLWLGRTSEIEATVMSVAPLKESPEVSLFCRVYFITSLGLWLTIKGEPEKGGEVLGGLVESPFFGMLPPSIRLLGLGHLLNALACRNKVEEVRVLAGKVLEIAAPTGNSFHSSYAHYCMSVAALLLGEPRRALSHAREARDRGVASASPIPERTNPLLEAQALIDLGNKDEARALLSEWVERWKETGFLLYASSGLAELAALSLGEGRVDEARELHERSVAIIPRDERPPQLHRPFGFTEALERALYVEQGRADVLTDPTQARVRIRTFGELSIEVGGARIYDRRWRGVATKTLLKAILSLGGMKISREVLADLLWPDADGAAALRNLKVALYRLRRTGIPKGREPLQWLVVKHKSISVSGALCYVDSLHFEQNLPAAMKDGAGIDRLAELLSIYTGDFLENDMSEPWIAPRRNLLRKMFIEGVLRLSRLAEKDGAHDLPVPYLEAAIDKDSLHEGLYERLMISHHRAGARSRALVVFRQAEEALERGLGTRPGPGLSTLADRVRAGKP